MATLLKNRLRTCARRRGGAAPVAPATPPVPTHPRPGPSAQRRCARRVRRLALFVADRGSAARDLPLLHPRPRQGPTHLYGTCIKYSQARAKFALGKVRGGAQTGRPVFRIAALRNCRNSRNCRDNEFARITRRAFTRVARLYYGVRSFP
jgi:hypothetical protein